MGEPARSSSTDSAFEQLLEVVPDGIVGVDNKGEIVFVNRRTETLFGYTRDELIGKLVETLVPEHSRDLHSHHRAGYFAKPRERPMGAMSALHGRRRDGSEFSAEISLSYIETDKGTVATATVRDVTKRRAAELKFDHFLEFAPDAIVGVMPTGEIVLVNQRAEVLFGYTRDELIGKLVETLVPERFRDRHPGHRGNYFKAPKVRPMGGGVELYAMRKDGTEFPAEISLSSIGTEQGTLATVAIRDVTDRAEGERERTLLEELNRARRLESIGQLAGGVAHDFNNILGVIINSAEFVRDELEPDSPARADVEEIRRTGERAAALTRQLLIFSRREVVKPELLDLGQIVSELENLLRKALGERVELKICIGEDLMAVKADPGQIEQVLVNLAINARDAMQGAGRLVIEVENAELDDEYAYMHPETNPGPYVRLKVSDTGSGMDKETVQRAFEPFFTTKGKAEGTGLGLATVYGIITGADGRVDIYSEPEMGTTIKVHLPASPAAPSKDKPQSGDRPAGRGEVVLIVEDELGVRRIAERILNKAGYSVIATSGGEEAIYACQQAGQVIHLVLTDVIMPGMLGTELVAEIKAIRPELGVIFMSGYSHEVLALEALADQRASAFIEKPFSTSELLQVVRNQLDSSS